MTLLNSELDDTKLNTRSKVEEVLQLKNVITKQELDNKCLQQKLQALLGDKQLLEKEIEEMQQEFLGIISKLQLLEEKDLQVRSQQEELNLFKSHIQSKDNEVLGLNSTLHQTKMD